MYSLIQRGLEIIRLLDNDVSFFLGNVNTAVNDFTSIWAQAGIPVLILKMQGYITNKYLSHGIIHFTMSKFV